MAVKVLSHDPAVVPGFQWPVPRAAYVHIPFCRHRCGYCHFSVVAGRLDLADPFLDALQIELERFERPQPVTTIFIGGGTPTRLDRTQLDRLFDMLARWCPLAEGGELTVEANPEDIDPGLMGLLRARGVNRVSLGVQSFMARKLRVLERGHDYRAARKAIEVAAGFIPNVSIDLIFATPEETLSDWADDLRIALSLPIDHLSTYSLTYEKGTRFWNRLRHGELSLLPEETELRMYEEARRLTREAGFGHYEISNFARPGRRCLHNMAYWLGRTWHAVGPGAARFVDGRREVNHRSPTTYISRMREGRSPVAESDSISPEQWACERAAFGIRMIDGVDLEVIRDETGISVAELRGPQIAKCVEHGWITMQGSHYRLTESGLLMADGVASGFL